MSVKDQNRRPIIIYLIVVLVSMVLINAIIVPQMSQPQVIEVDYGTFIDWVEAGEVSYVQVEDQAISFLLEEDVPRAEPDIDSDGGTEPTGGSLDGQTVTPGLGAQNQWQNAWGRNLLIYQTSRMEDPQLTDRLLGSNVIIRRVYPEPMNPLVSMLVGIAFPLLFFVLIGWLMRKQLSKTSNSLQFGSSNARIYVPEEGEKKTFADVAGADEAKNALTEVVDFLKNPQRYQAIGAKCPKGVLLVGPPGTGKTLLAKAVAGEADVPFFSISGSEFVEMFVGMGAAKVRDLFSQAKKKAPCIVFIDEIDTIGKKRDSGGLSTNDEREQTLNQLLTEMDGFQANEGVVLLAATNRPDSLDKALLRPGRFDRRVTVDLPDLQGRADILRVHARNVKMDHGIDYETVARQTAGTSGAELANIINEGALRAVRAGRSTVSQEDLEASVDVVIAGAEKTSAVISPKEKKVIAYHEVGHALVAARQSGTAPVEKITIVPRTSGALGFTMQAETSDKYLYSKDELLSTITTLTGGRAAEEVIFNIKTTGASNDIEKATKIARSMITQYGMSDEFGFIQLETQQNIYLGGENLSSASQASAAKVDAEAIEIVEGCLAKAKAILSKDEAKLHEISRFLLEKETITGAEFMEILEHDPTQTQEIPAVSAQEPAETQSQE